MVQRSNFVAMKDLTIKKVDTNLSSTLLDGTKILQEQKNLHQVKTFQIMAKKSLNTHFTYTTVILIVITLQFLMLKSVYRNKT